MVTLAGLVTGALAGFLVARHKGLRGLDVAHYAGVGAIALGALSILALVVLSRFN